MSEEAISPVLLACVRDARGSVAKAAAVQPAFQTTGQKQTALRELEAQVAVWLTVIAAARDVSEKAVPEGSDWSGS